MKTNRYYYILLLALVLAWPVPVFSAAVLDFPAAATPSTITPAPSSVTTAASSTTAASGYWSKSYLHYESLEFHPYLSLKETYNDNIFAVPTDTKADWITTITPGLRLALPYRQHLFTAEYNAVINTYSRYGSEDTTDQNAKVLGDFKFGSRFGLTLSDTYNKGHEPRYQTVTGVIEKYERNASTASGTYRLADRAMIEVDYTRTKWNFVTSEFRSRNEDMVATYFYYRIMPKTSAFVEYDLTKYSYDLKTNGLDSSVNSGFMGLRWEMSATTQGTVKAGWLQKRFEAGNKQDLQTWGASADMKWAITDYSFLSFLAKRDVNESAALGATYYVTTGAYVDYTHKLTYKIAAVGRLSYGADEYSNPLSTDTVARTDRTFLGGAGLKYQMRDWLEFLLDYNYRNRDSNITTWNLKQNTYSLTANFAL